MTPNPPTPQVPPPESLPKPPPMPPGRSGADPAAKPPAFGRREFRSMLPPRLVINAVEGWGKTSLLAHAPQAALLYARGETGYETLASTGQVPSIDAAMISRWGELPALLEQFIAADQVPFRILGLDSLGCFEELAREHVLRESFGGNEDAFLAWGRGPDQCATRWESLLGQLDQLWRKHLVSIVVLGHVKIKPFRDPGGADYDRFISDVNARIWEPTKRWADAVLFGRFKSVVREAPGGGKGKGIGGTERILMTQHHDAYDAKNRYGLPPVLTLAGVGPGQAHKHLMKHIRKER